ncbi:DEAD/DEAH box helicase [Alicyclobacillus tolerans]|uniref:ATP-dependent RNA helicase CshA n=2 Tax=Alicyclobacillus tolerans TaxID=90970 RepID=A0A1M6RGE9_9BACL|nr:MULTISPECIES: DEAD/DEAH box helicase [Alicyclobacillus]MDP9728915.1 ATP-dependent RNA helicase DeaD [Alicyclobacillus tengchongensis]QRF23661.1 DEAD/DEAH box helicase [Alicyclobacillus sp. TC]SHK31544.1 ATP-dependent RNA helicase DeaD [Alicyclobacillus montanus]
MSSFAAFNLSKKVQQAIDEMGYEEPSPIQAAAIPVILSGVDVIGQAQTGTGKTAAFGIPLVETVSADHHVQALVLTPTRELAIQVAGEFRKIAKYKRVRALPIYGGQSIGHQIRTIQQGVQIIIGTPGRVLDHIRRGTLRLSQVRTVVLDEADEMLDMGFIEDIESILQETPDQRQTLLFSATFPNEVRRLAGRYMSSPEHVTVNRGEVTVPRIDQVYYKVLERNKLESLCRIIDSEEVSLGIIFCRTKRGVDELVEALLARGYLVDGLHGDLSQAQRDRVMKRFRTNDIELLVATDVAARGIDVDNVTHVINYDIPQDPESYVHRIGRTGRAGKQGLAITLVTPREFKLLKQIERETKSSMILREVPSLADVAERQAEIWRNRVIEAIQDGGLGHYRAVLGRVIDDYDPIDIACALLKIASAGDLQAEEQVDYDFGDTGASPGMVRFFVNIGRAARMSPADFVRAISDEAGVPGQAVGKIDIFDRFTFIEIEEESAPFVYEALKQTRINGARVNMEPAKPRARVRH